MKRFSRPTGTLTACLAFLLLVADTRELRAQGGDTSADERAALKLATEVIEGKNKEIQGLREQISNLQSENEKLKLESAVVEKEKELMAQREKDLREIIDAERKKVETLEAGIKDRDTVIKELVRGSKESTARKIVETIPAVAGIVAIAIAAK